MSLEDEVAKLKAQLEELTRQQAAKEAAEAKANAGANTSSNAAPAPTKSMSDVIDKIRKLRSLSQSSNVHEAAAASAMASKLADQYRIDEADLELENETVEDVSEDQTPIYETGRAQIWKSHLAVILARHYGCGIYINNGYRAKKYKLVGKKSDMEIAKYFFAWLTGEIARLCALEMKGQGHVACNSYCQGAVAGIKAQLEKSRQETIKTAVNTGHSSALVRLDNREAEVKNYLAKLNLSKGNQRSQGRFDHGAFAQGKQKGEGMHLGKAMSGEGKASKLLK